MKYPFVAQLRFTSGERNHRHSQCSRLHEPFLSPGGSLHTTPGIERSQLHVRWLVLALTSLLMTGNYYCYDNPSALYQQLKSTFDDLPSFDYYFDLLYSVYSIPNIFLPMAGGILVDRVGVLFSLNLFFT